MAKNTQKKKIGRGGTRQWSGAKPKYNEETKTNNMKTIEALEQLAETLKAKIANEKEPQVKLGLNIALYEVYQSITNLLKIESCTH